ncbi:uncharacterized protein C11orf16 homolog isoform X2 [Engystomops pustulosus]|uniref:uncharacterized protein C11orf16 homolog isoform X2 n=1 Tax=Engystomops pustulosus TaxID=76066 RepID=UPI003AFB66F7
MTASPSFPCVTSIIRRGTVLARRDADGFYYVGAVRDEEEPGVFLVEFREPCVGGERFPSMLQKTRASDIIQYEEALRRCIVPGDNVLAPWEPQTTRYGPGTVLLGLETRDPLRAAEDEELTIRFWNGKKSTVALKLAVWISPSAHHRIVDGLQRPISSRLYEQDTAGSSSTYVIRERCSTAPITTCSAHHIHRHAHSHLPHCCSPTHSICTCCHDPKCQDWWSLSPRTTVYVPGKEEPNGEELISTLKMKAERLRERRYSSSSSQTEGNESSDDESDDETRLSRTTQSTMVDSAVNTDSSLWEKTKTDLSDRPEWKYWKRSQPEPFYRKPGIMKSKNKSATAGSKVATLSDLYGASNQSALFETISDSPSRRLTMRDVLVHTDFNPSLKDQASPAVERLGESEVVKLQKKKETEDRQQQKKIKHLEWEQKREKEAGEKYSGSQEAHRLKTLQRLQNEEQKLKDAQARNINVMKTKMATQEERSDRHQTMATEEKKKEERRLGHLRKEAQRRKFQDHYKQVAERVFQAEQQEGRSGHHRELTVPA